MTDILPLDPDSDDHMAVAAGLMTEVWREALGDDEPATEPAEMATTFRQHAADAELLGWFALDGDEPVGLAVVEVRTGRGNEDRAWVHDLWVRPGSRRRGAGRKLLDAVVAAARARGRTIVDLGHQVPHAGGEAFAAAVGCTRGLVEDQNRAPTAGFDRALLESWAVPAEGYSLVAFDGPCPDELVEDFVRLVDVMNTAPMPDSMEPTVFTAAMQRDVERRVAERGAVRWTVCARHDASGALAGFTELTINPYRPWVADQGDTGVAVEHRGHGIGRWVKAVNALRLLDERPEVTFIETWNASSNEHMLAINHAMGFRCVARWQDVELAI